MPYGIHLAFCANYMCNRILNKYIDEDDFIVLQFHTAVFPHPDVDECAVGTHNCARAGPEYQCHNIPGSFRCVRKRTTTTSTTPQPIYEYYYDSE